ncbi:MAG: hypothetical protein UHP25_08750 [Prevotella sp.]|nr:hypothetical protein [Prevotella sp.]
MIKLGRLLLIAIMSCMIASSCSDDKDVKIIPIDVPQVPLNIEATEKKVLFLVDNEAELIRRFAGHTKNLPQIDFKNFKLLMIHGLSACQVKEITTRYEKSDSGDCYYMYVDVETGDVAKESYWTAAYLVPRSFNTPIGLALTVGNISDSTIYMFKFK